MILSHPTTLSLFPPSPALALYPNPTCGLDISFGDAFVHPLSISPDHSEDDTIGDLKKLVAAQTGTRPEKIRIQKWYNIYKDHITLAGSIVHITRPSFISLFVRTCVQMRA